MEEITLRLSVDSVNAATSIKELKDVIRSATNEALKFSDTSKEFAHFADIASKAKDKLGDFKNQMQALDPDARAQSFLRLGQSIAGGFTAGLGAVNLFTGGSEEAQKSLLKVQSALALLHGFQSIQDGVQAFTALKGAIMVAVAGMNAMKLAIIGTGIGALVVAVGFLVTKLIEAGEAFKSSTVEITDHQVEVAKLTIEYEKLTGQITDLEAELKIMGVTHEQTLNKIQLDAEKKIEAATGFWSRLGDAVKDVAYRVELGSNTLRNVQKIKEAADIEAIKELEKYNLEVSNKFLEAEAKKEAQEKKAGEDQLKRKIEQNQKLREEDQKNQTDEKLNLEAHLNAQGIVFDAILFKYIDFSKKAEVVLKKMEVSRENTFTRMLKKEQDKLKKEQELANARIQIEQSVFSTLGMIGNAMIKNQEKQIKFQKKLAAVQMIVSQVEALAQAVKAGAGLVYPANLVAIASGVGAVIGVFAGIASLFAKVSDVAAETLDTGAGGFSGAGAAISASTPSPSGVNFLEQPSTQLGGSGNPPPPPTPIIIENSISETEITRVQGKVSSVNRQATITD